MDGLEAVECGFTAHDFRMLTVRGGSRRTFSAATAAGAVSTEGWVVGVGDATVLSAIEAEGEENCRARTAVKQNQSSR